MIKWSALTNWQWACLFFLYPIQCGEICTYHDTMRNGQPNDHHSNNSCRKACDSPQNVNSRFKNTKEMRVTTVSHHRKCSDRWNPELNDTNGHIETKQDKWSLITMPNTSLRPHTMMIKLINTLTTGATMWHSGKFIIIAFITMSCCQQIFWIDNFIFYSLDVEKFWQLWYSVPYTISLNITPYTHEHVKPCEIWQYFC